MMRISGLKPIPLGTAMASAPHRWEASSTKGAENFFSPLLSSPLTHLLLAGLQGAMGIRRAVAASSSTVHKVCCAHISSCPLLAYPPNLKPLLHVPQTRPG